MTKYIFFVIIFIYSNYSYAGILCSIFDICPKDVIDSSSIIIDNAIRDIENMNNDWKVVVETTRDKFIQEGQSTIRNEISNLLEKFTGDLFAKTSCFSDELMMRKAIKVDLLTLEAKIIDENNNIRLPIFCNPVPSSVNYEMVQKGRLNEIYIYGYNLNSARVKAFLVDKSGMEQDVSLFIANPSPYLLTLNLSKNGIPIDKNSQKIVFRFNIDLPNLTLPKNHLRVLMNELRLEERSINITEPRHKEVEPWDPYWKQHNEVENPDKNWDPYW